MAHLANCSSMIDIYLRGGDLHVETAMECFGVTDPEKLDKVGHRIPAKIANFLCMYQGSGKALYAQILMAMLVRISEGKMDTVPAWLTVEWCDDFVVKWFEKRPEVQNYLDLQGYRARRYGRSWDLFGGCRLVPEVKSYLRWIKEAGVRQAGNLADQGSCAGLMKLAMAEVDQIALELWESGTWAWPLVPVHDQLIVEVEESEAEDFGAVMQDVFNNVATDRGTGEQMLRVPIGSDVEITKEWRKEG